MLPANLCKKLYNWSTKDWIPLSTLGGKSLIFSERNDQVVAFSEIYQFYDGGCLVYSIEDGEVTEFSSVNSNLMEDAGSDSPEYKV